MYVLNKFTLDIQGGKNYLKKVFFHNNSDVITNKFMKFGTSLLSIKMHFFM